MLALGIGEIIGGSQREERLKVLDARMAECHIDPEHYAWYRDLRRYGTVPHAGFGLGFERTLAYVTGLSNVRDAIPFPRTPGEREVLTRTTSALAFVFAVSGPESGSQQVAVSTRSATHSGRAPKSAARWSRRSQKLCRRDAG